MRKFRIFLNGGKVYPLVRIFQAYESNFNSSVLEIIGLTLEGINTSPLYIQTLTPISP